MKLINVYISVTFIEEGNTITKLDQQTKVSRIVTLSHFEDFLFQTKTIVQHALKQNIFVLPPTELISICFIV